jgi:hypothetical protein
MFGGYRAGFAALAVPLGLVALGLWRGVLQARPAAAIQGHRP